MTRGAHEFELRVFPRGRSAYGLSLFERPAGHGGSNGNGFERVVRIWGDPLSAVVDEVLGALRRAGYRSSQLRPVRTEPFLLDEVDGARLGLLFLAVKPLRKHRRIEDVWRRVRSMEPEEVWYWYAKMSAHEDAARAGRARRALRVLIAEE